MQGAVRHRDVPSLCTADEHTQFTCLVGEALGAAHGLQVPFIATLIPFEGIDITPPEARVVGEWDVTQRMPCPNLSMGNPMNDSLISTLGLLLCLAPGLVHAAEMVSPMLSRWVINVILPFFGPGLPRSATSLTYDEQIAMLDAAREAGPAGKDSAADDYIFVMLFEQRQGGIAFLSVMAGVVYGLGLSVDGRAPLHLMFGVMSVLFVLVNANHGGIPGLGHHPRVSRHGRNVGIVFAPFWTAAASLNLLAFANATA